MNNYAILSVLFAGIAIGLGIGLFINYLVRRGILK